MTAVDLVEDLRARGVEFRPDGERLVCRPRSLLSEDDLMTLKRMKVEVLALLREDRTEPAPARLVCYACKGTRFWQSIHGATVCARCHPPAHSDLVAAWSDHD